MEEATSKSLFVTNGFGKGVAGYSALFFLSFYNLVNFLGGLGEGGNKVIPGVFWYLFFFAFFIVKLPDGEFRDILPAFLIVPHGATTNGIFYVRRVSRDR